MYKVELSPLDIDARPNAIFFSGIISLCVAMIGITFYILTIYSRDGFKIEMFDDEDDPEMKHFAWVDKGSGEVIPFMTVEFGETPTSEDDNADFLPKPVA
jgi:hypothetical protein